MGRGKRAYGTYGEGGTRKGKIIWNVKKRLQKIIKKKKEEISARVNSYMNSTLQYAQCTGSKRFNQETGSFNPILLCTGSKLTMCLFYFKFLFNIIVCVGLIVCVCQWGQRYIQANKYGDQRTFSIVCYLDFFQFICCYCCCLL